MYYVEIDFCHQYIEQFLNTAYNIQPRQRTVYLTSIYQFSDLHTAFCFADEAKRLQVYIKLTFIPREVPA